MDRRFFGLLTAIAGLGLTSAALTGCESHTRDDDAGAVPVDAAPDAVVLGCDGCSHSDAPIVRICGGFAGLTCGPTEYCDFPDGSFCGGDDSTGVCVPRPTECPEPGGVTVCGCDGNEYLGECSANFAGIDVEAIGPCVTTHAYRTAKAEADCGPTDGPAWTFTLTTSRASCDETRTDGSIVISVWSALDGISAPTTFQLTSDFTGDGHAEICGMPGEPCSLATGTIVIDTFAPSEVARFDFDVTTADGRRFAETDLEIAAFWCRVTPPGCG